jgi:hypothetical protein
MVSLPVALNGSRQALIWRSWRNPAPLSGARRIAVSGALLTHGSMNLPMIE